MSCNFLLEGGGGELGGNFADQSNSREDGEELHLPGINCEQNGCPVLRVWS